MDRMSKKVVSLVVLGTMLGGQVVYATSNIQEGNEKVKKDESVYVTLTEKGEVKEKIVSDWLHLNKTNMEIKDKSELKNIENVKGDEKPETNGENLVWKTDKNDIYYRGKTDKELPLEVKLTYELDGKEVNPKEIVGKSGKLKITLKVINKDAHKVTVKGKEKTIYTPFSSVSVINLPLDNFTNIKVNTGEVISDGNNQVVTFISLPGMKESLDIDEDTLDVELKDTLELTCDAKDFQMGPIMVTATSKLPEELKKVKEAKNLDELTDGLNKMKDAGDKLVDGTSKLSDGAKLMSDKIGLLHSAYSGLDSGIATVNLGSKKLYEGANKLSQGTSMLADEVSKIKTPDMNEMKGKMNTLGNGITEVDKGAQKFAESLPALQKGTEQLLDGANKLNGGLTGIDNGLDKVNGGLDQLYAGQEKQEEGIKQLIQGITQMEGLIATMPEGQQKQVLKGGLAKQKAALQQIQNEGIGKTKAGINSTKGGIKNLKGGVAKLKEGVDNKNPKKPGLVQGLSTMNTNTIKVVAKSKDLAEGTKQLKEGFAKGMAGIDEKLKAVDPSKIVQLKQATKQLDAGANELKNGLGKLSSGSDKLKDGSTKVTTGISALKNGSNTLAEKSVELKDGMAKFDKEGIKEMDNKLGNKVRDAEELLATKDEVVKLGDDYKTFTGTGEDMEGSVKFIMKTDEIEKKKEEKKEEVKKEEKGFFKKIIDFFKGEK